MALKKEDLKIGATYCGKRRMKANGINNDRTIVWINPERTKVQYDSDTVKTGRHLPIIAIDVFLNWVKEEVRATNDIQALPK